MVSPIQWTWVWVNSGSWWWTGRPGVLQSMGSQRVGHNWATELNSTVQFIYIVIYIYITINCYIYLTFVTFKTYCRNLNSSFTWVHDTLSFFKILLGYFSECPLHLLESCLPDQSYFNSMFIKDFFKVTINLPQQSKHIQPSLPSCRVKCGIHSSMATLGQGLPENADTVEEKAHTESWGHHTSCLWYWGSTSPGPPAA